MAAAAGFATARLTDEDRASVSRAEPIPPSSASSPIGLVASAGIGNVTAGQPFKYQESTTAMVDDVLQFQVIYGNEHSARGEIPSLSVRFELPTAAGKNQSIIAELSSGDTRVRTSAQVTLSLEQARLRFIPGSVRWRRNVAVNGDPEYETTSLSDEPVLRSTGLHNLRWGRENWASVTLQVRVVAEANSVIALGSTGEGPLEQRLTARPGQRIEVEIRYRNEGNVLLRDVHVGNNLAPGMSFVANSTTIERSTRPGHVESVPDGVVDPDHPTGNGRPDGHWSGIGVGDVGVGETIRVRFQADIRPTVREGADLRNVSFVRAVGLNEFFNVLEIQISD